ncbi:MAG: hypothetical protein FJX76_28630 [Armatimonadetes bacterium]|nr:hypothetical protein [Armatimonadota bacterium]
MSHARTAGVAIRCARNTHSWTAAMGNAINAPPADWPYTPMRTALAGAVATIRVPAAMAASTRG